MDLTFISDFFVNVSAFFQSIWDYVYIGIYDFFKEIMVFFTKVAIYSYIQMTIFAYDVAYEVLQDILVDLGISQKIESAYLIIPEDMRNTLDFFGIPQALTIIFSAIPTRLAMRFIPFIGR